MIAIKMNVLQELTRLNSRIIWLCFLFLPFYGMSQEKEFAGENDVKAFVCKWFAGSDSKVSHEYYLPLMVDDVVMCLPTDTIYSKEAFIDWRTAFSARLKWNQHNLESIKVVPIDETYYYVSIDINWLGMTTKGNRIAKNIHQDWYIERSDNNLKLVERQVVLLNDGDTNQPYHAEGTATNPNTIKQFIYEWFAAIEHNAPMSFFEERNHAFLLIELIDAKGGHLFENWRESELAYYHIISNIGLKYNEEPRLPTWFVDFELSRIDKNATHPIAEQTINCRMIFYDYGDKVLLRSCSFSKKQ